MVLTTWLDWTQWKKKNNQIHEQFLAILLTRLLRKTSSLQKTKTIPQEQQVKHIKNNMFPQKISQTIRVNEKKGKQKKQNGKRNWSGIEAAGKKTNIEIIEYRIRSCGRVKPRTA